MLLEQVINQILDHHQRTEQINAGSYERIKEQKGQRNGFKPRTLATRVRTLI